MTQVIRTKEEMKKAQNMPMNDNEKKAENQIAQMPDPMALSQALMNACQKSTPMLMNMMEQYQSDMMQQKAEPVSPDPMNIMPDAFELMNAMTTNPMKYWSMQMDHAQKQMDLWKNTAQKFTGKDVDPIIEPHRSDRRFKDEAWNDSAMFDFIKQYYLLACDFVNTTIENTEGMNAQQKDKLQFTAKLMMDAISPSNFLMTNPVVLNETINSGGQNLVRGMQNLQKDLERGHGELNISMTDYNAFELGKNIATTPGHVVYENDLMQLIQYEPTTEKVAKRPLLIVPPWINKFYILDLRPENSFIRWAVEQGHTVFCISWVNPDAELAQKTFEDYMKEGILSALDEIQNITGEEDCNTAGYCLGGTLLMTTLSYLAAKKQSKRIASATFLTTLVDFEKAGDMKFFMSEAQIREIDRIMKDGGVFPGSRMKQTFSLLRSNDLIWSFVVNNYLLGKEPFPFDLLYWNDDATNLPSAMHRFYLQNMYQDNVLKDAGGIEIDGVKIDVRKVKTPCYFLSTREDHIAPWKATYENTQLVSGPKTFTLAASGHIAGVINAPSKNKYCFWSSEDAPESSEAWLDGAKETDGSWWPHWQNWLSDYDNGEQAARKIKKPIEAAPGRYVHMKSD